MQQQLHHPFELDFPSVTSMTLAGSTLQSFLAASILTIKQILILVLSGTLPIARNNSSTFIAVFADVSINNKLFSSAYDRASFVQKY